MLGGRNRKRVIVAAGIVVAVALLGLIGVPFLGGLAAERLRRVVEDRGSRWIDGTVQVGRIDFDLFPPAVHARDVRVTREGNRGSHAEGTIDRVSVAAGPLTLLGWRQGSIALRVTRPRLEVRLVDGHDLLPPRPDGGEGVLGIGALVPPGSTLTIEDAVLDLDRDGGLKAKITGLTADLERRRGDAWLAGRVAWSDASMRQGAAELKGIRAEATFTAAGEVLRLESFAMRGEGGVALSGRLAIGGGQGVTGRLEASADLAALAGLLPREAGPSGRIDLKLEGEWGADGAHARGSLKVVALRLWGLPVDSLLADVAIDEQIRFNGIRAHLFGGTATGAVAVSPGPAGARTEGDIALDGIDLKQLLEFGGWQGPALAGTVHYVGHHLLVGASLEGMTGSGVLDAVGTYRAPRGGELPLEVHTRVGSAGLTLRLEEGSVRAGSVRGGFSGVARPGEGIRLKLRGASGDISEILPLFAVPDSGPRKAPAVKDDAPGPGDGGSGGASGAPPGEARPVRLVAYAAVPARASALERIIAALGGRWTWDGDLEYGRAGLAFEGALGGEGLTLHGVALGTLRSVIGYRNENLTLKEATLRMADGGSVQFTGSASFQGEGHLRLAAIADDCPVEPLLRLAGSRLPIGGSVDARIEIGGRPAAPEGTAVIDSNHLTIGGVAVDAAHGTIGFTSLLLRVSSLTLTQGPGELSLNGSIPWGDGEAAIDQGRPAGLTIEGRRLDLAALGGLLGGLPISGTGEITGHLEGSLQAPIGALKLAGRDVVMRGLSLGDLQAGARFVGEAAEVTLEVPRFAASMEGRIELGDGWPADLRMRLAGTELQGQEFIAGAPEEAVLRIEGGASLSGPLGDPLGMTASALLQRVTLEGVGITVSTETPVDLQLRDRLLRLAPVRLVGDGTSVTLDAAVDTSSGGQVQASARGSFDLRILRPFSPGLQATGEGVIELAISGSAEQPGVSGSLQVNAEAIRHPDLPFPVDALVGRAVFEKQQLRIESLEFLAGGGRVEGSGRVLLGGIRDGGQGILSVRRAKLHFRGKNVRAEFPRGFRSVSDLDMTLDQDEQGVRSLHGSIDLVRGVYDRDFRVESSLVRGAGVEFFEMQGPREALASVRLDLRLRAEQNLWLRNDFGTLEGEGELTVGGTAAEPTVSGRITAIEGGTVRFRKVRYRVRSGTLDFADPARINPIFDLRAETTIQEYSIGLHVEGTSDDFNYELSSAPALPPQDIVSLLLTGRTLGSLGPEGGLLAEEMASSYLAGRLSEELSERVAARAGLDVIAIDPMHVTAEGDPAARMTLGKQVTPDLFVTYTDDLGSSQSSIYQLDYSIGKAFKFSSLRDRNGSIGGDFKFIVKRDPPSLPALTPAGDEAPPVIGHIELQGETRFEEATIRRRLRLKPGRPRDRAAINDAAERLIAFYRQRDYLMVEVDINEQPISEGRVNLRARIEAGPRVIIEFEEARGREGLRRQIAPLWQEGIFQEDIVDAARDALSKIYRDRGYLSASVSSNVLVESPEIVDVRFTVDRGPRVQAERFSIEGARQIPEGELLKVMRTHRDSAWSRGIVRESRLEQDLAAIRGLYLSRGFPHVAVSPPRVILNDTRTRARVIIHVDEGPRVVVRDLRVEGTTATGIVARAKLGGLRGQPFAAVTADEATARLRKAFDDGGYPDVTVSRSLEPLKQDDLLEEIILVLNVRPGRHQKVGEVDISGNLITRDRVIRKGLKVKPGDNLSRGDLLASTRRLYQRGIFSSVSIQPVPPAEATPGTPPEPPATALAPPTAESTTVAAPGLTDDGGADGPGPVVRDIEVKVQETAPLTQVFGIGYDTEERVRGQYEIANHNVLGTGRFLGFQTRDSRLKQRASTLFRDAGVFGGRYDVLASAYWEEERRPAFDVQTIGSSLQFERKFTRATRTLYRYSLRDVNLSDPSVSFDESTLRLANIAVTAVHDTRDSPFDPLRGHFMTGEVEFYGSGVGSEADFTKLYTQLYFFNEIFPGTVWAQALRAGAAISFGHSASDPVSTGDSLSGVPPTERFFAGGDTTLRGFRRDRVGPLDINGDPIGGEGLFLLNEELRFPIFSMLQGVVFYEAGNVYRTLEDYDVGDLRHVAGAGLRITTPIGPFRFEYGVILDRQEGEPRGEFFVSIGQAF